jgi:hypothetical protein
MLTRNDVRVCPYKLDTYLNIRDSTNFRTYHTNIYPLWDLDSSVYVNTTQTISQVVMQSSFNQVTYFRKRIFCCVILKMSLFYTNHPLI